MLPTCICLRPVTNKTEERYVTKQGTTIPSRIVLQDTFPTVEKPIIPFFGQIKFVPLHRMSRHPFPLHQCTVRITQTGEL
jgi:hypothetical protein